jgi:hypothetical protein
MESTLNQVHVELIEDSTNKLFGIVIMDLREGFFLKTTKQDIEDWVKENGEEGIDFNSEKEWFDEYPEGGHFYNEKTLIADAWEDQLRDYAFAHRKLWVQDNNE